MIDIHGLTLAAQMDTHFTPLTNSKMGKENIKYYHHSQVFRYPTRTYIPSEANIEEGIKDIISSLVMKKMNEIKDVDVTYIDLMFIDSIYQKAKGDLKSHYVDLMDFSIVEVVKYTEDMKTVAAASLPGAVPGTDGKVKIGGKDVDEDEVIALYGPVLLSENPDFQLDENEDEEDVATESFIITIVSEES